MRELPPEIIAWNHRPKTNIASGNLLHSYWKYPIEIIELPFQNGGSFHSILYIYTYNYILYIIYIYVILVYQKVKKNSCVLYPENIDTDIGLLRFHHWRSPCSSRTKIWRRYQRSSCENRDTSTTTRCRVAGGWLMSSPWDPCSFVGYIIYWMATLTISIYIYDMHICIFTIYYIDLYSKY